MNRIGKRLSPVLVRAGETLLAVGFVLVFFLGFLAILGASFPQGTGLADLLHSSDYASQSRTSRFEVDLGGSANSGPETESFVAVLTEVSRKVKDKPPSAISWSSVSADSKLRDRHAVQTFERSGATIAFDASNRLRLAESSLVIVRRLQREPTRRARRASLVVLDGELSGRITAAGEEAMTLEIVTGEATSTIRSATSDPTDFRVSTDRGDAATLDIYNGKAEVTSGGKTIQVVAPSSVTLRSGEVPSAPVRLPDAPTPNSPVSGEVRSYATVRPEIEFQWETGEDAEGWLLEIARDSRFEQLVHRGRLASSKFVHGQLPDGQLFWRVRATKGSAQGPYSETRTFTVAEDHEPPTLNVEVERNEQAADELVVRGVTEPGSDVFVAQQQVAVDSAGGFETVVRIKRGMRVIVVEAFDMVGNVTYRSEPVDARYQR